jgi:hypothetical protein
VSQLRREKSRFALSSPLWGDNVEHCAAHDHSLKLSLRSRREPL